MYNALVNAAAFIILILLIGRIFDVVMDLLLGILTNLFGPTIAFLFSNVITFVGVVHHELSHALFAFLTGARVTRIQLFSIFNKDGTLGSVQFSPRGGMILQSIQLCLSSIAPMVTGCISLYYIYNAYMSGLVTGVWFFVMIYVAISILFHMRLSSQDIFVALKGLPVCFIILVVIFYLLNIDILSLLEMSSLASPVL